MSIRRVLTVMGSEWPATPDAVRKLDELFENFGRRVLAYAARRTPTLADAEDAAAETFAIAWRKIEQMPDDALPWLLAVARRVLANQRRGDHRRESLVARLGQRVSSHHAPSIAGESADGPALSALARLRTDDQELLRLVAWDELDHAAIAIVLGITPNAVAIRLHRARKRFEEELKDSRRTRTDTEAKGAINGAVQERTE